MPARMPQRSAPSTAHSRMTPWAPPFDGGALLSEGDAGISAGRGREDERWIPSDTLQASSHRTGERLDGIDDRVEASRAEQIEPVLRAG